MHSFKVALVPDKATARTNRAILNPLENLAKFEHIAVRHPGGQAAFVFTIGTNDGVKQGQAAFNISSRKWASLQVDKFIEAAPYKFDTASQCLASITFSVDFVARDKAPTHLEFDTSEMAMQFSQQFSNQAFTKNQLFAFIFSSNNKDVSFELQVIDMEAVNMNQLASSGVEIGLTTSNTVIIFEPAPGCNVKLTGKMTGGSAPQILNQNWDFSSMGIGGLGEQFNELFRRAFASRLLPPRFAEAIGVQQVRGILLHGPPGTGKTLIARQIGKMLLAREPKVVNGPEVLNKYVGESEANIRKLFQEAEEEQAKYGLNSGLHMIIFDEIDAICKGRGSNPSSAGVGDNVVNQLLSKIDGVNALHNVLLVGMTNRKDLIDEALLRPGRFEVQIEIGLPDAKGRLEILNIHTKKMQDTNVLDHTVDLGELALLTKNFTGAEIAGLIKAAMSRAIGRVVTIDSKVVIDEEKLKEIVVTQDDFIKAMENDVKPALGRSEDKLNDLARPIISWDPIVDHIQQDLSRIVQQISSDRINNRPYIVLLHGKPGVGLTTVAANMASQTNFPFIRIYNNEQTTGEPESVKIQYMKKLFQDGARSELSCIVLDDLDIILDYNHIGPTFSKNLTNCLRILKDRQLPKNYKMLVICTSKSLNFLQQLHLDYLFRRIIKIPSMVLPKQVEKYMELSVSLPFMSEQVSEIIGDLDSLDFDMGVKTLETIISDMGNYEPPDRVQKFKERIYDLKLVKKADNQFGF